MDPEFYRERERFLERAIKNLQAELDAFRAGMEYTGPRTVIVSEGQERSDG